MEKKLRKTPQEMVAHMLYEKYVSCNLSMSSIKDLVPKKWEKVGDVVILKNILIQRESSLPISEEDVAQALMQVLKVKCILIDEGGISGEFRQPCCRQVINYKENQSTITTHVENHVKYRLDAAKIMFASGNGTERMRFSRLRMSNEIVVDMFAGIGYFSLPLATANRDSACKIISIEKNPESFQFLCQNIEINHLQDVLSAELGDNREVGNAFLGKANRVIMGYLPTPKQFLQRAFSFLKPTGGLVHYHFISHKHESMQLPHEHFEEELSLCNHNKLLMTHSPTPNLMQFKIENCFLVKSYAPQLFHYVADVSIFTT